MTATTLPSDLKDFRLDWMAKVGLGASDVGALPDASHKAGGGYHCGVQDIIDIGKYPTLDYSTRQTRDRIGGNACSAVDTGLNWGNGGQAAAIRFNNLLVQQMIAKDPALAALRGINYTPDGKVKRRYDSNNPSQGIISSTDTVLWHTHFEWWRNTANTSARQQSFDRMLQLADAAINNQSSISGGSGMTTLDTTVTCADGGSRPIFQLILDLWNGFYHGGGTANPANVAQGDYATKFPRSIYAELGGGDIPPFTQDQINEGILTALQNPAVLAAFANAINDDAAARLAE